jgi:hypothetical protein
MKTKAQQSELMEHSKGSLRGKFIAMSAYIKHTERSQLYNLMLRLKHLEKQQVKPKTSIRREMIKNKGQN